MTGIFFNKHIGTMISSPSKVVNFPATKTLFLPVFVTKFDHLTPCRGRSMLLVTGCLVTRRPDFLSTAKRALQFFTTVLKSIIMLRESKNCLFKPTYL